MKEKKLYNFTKSTYGDTYNCAMNVMRGGKKVRVSIQAPKERGETRAKLEKRLVAYLIENYGEPVA